MAGLLEAGDASYNERVERRLESLVYAFKARYGEELDDETWARFLADNS